MRVVELDPEIIIVLTARRDQHAAFHADFRALEVLGAVKRSRFSVIEAPEAFANGPGILALVDRFAGEIRRLSPAIAAPEAP